MIQVVYFLNVPFFWSSRSNFSAILESPANEIANEQDVDVDMNTIQETLNENKIIVANNNTLQSTGNSAAENQEF